MPGSGGVDWPCGGHACHQLGLLSPRHTLIWAGLPNSHFWHQGPCPCSHVTPPLLVCSPAKAPSAPSLQPPFAQRWASSITFLLPSSLLAPRQAQAPSSQAESRTRIRTYERSPKRTRSPFIQMNKRAAQREKRLAHGCTARTTEPRRAAGHSREGTPRSGDAPAGSSFPLGDTTSRPRPPKGLRSLVSPAPFPGVQGGPPQPGRTPEPLAPAGHRGQSCSPNFPQQGEASEGHQVLPTG